MATFILRGCYTQEGLKGLVSSPEDRTAPIAKAFEALGAKLINYYATTGDTDFMIIVEADAVEAVAAASLVAGASGAVSNLSTTRAWSSAELMAIAEKAKGVVAAYKAPG